MKLHVHPFSGHSHRAVPCASPIGAPVEIVAVDLAKGAHKRRELLTLNPFGQVPVLEDDGTAIADAEARLRAGMAARGPTDGGEPPVHACDNDP